VTLALPPRGGECVRHVVLRRFAFSACQTGIPQTTPREQPTRKDQRGGPLGLWCPELAPSAAITCRTRNTLPGINLMPGRFPPWTGERPGRALRIRCLRSETPPIATMLQPRLSSHGHCREVVAQRHVLRDVLLRDPPFNLVFSLLYPADIAIDDAGMVLLADELVALRMLE
jgi:hypothetical protein